MAFLRQLLDVITAPVRLLLAAPRRLLEGSRRIGGLSLPARLMILTYIVLLLMVACAIVGTIFFTRERTFWWATLTPAYLIITAVLVLVIPLVFYKALQLWLEGDPSRDTDIDRAWRAGLEELDRQGIDIRQIPLFLVLGTSSLRQEKALFDAARLDLVIRDVPAGRAPLHWYAGHDAVFLICSEVGSLSHIAALGEKALESDRHAPVRPSPESGNIRQTVVLPGADLCATANLATKAPLPRPAAKPNIMGTMVMSSMASEPGGTAHLIARDPRAVIRLDKDQVTTNDRRSAYLASLIRRLRQPVAPINGILTLLPFGLIQRGDPEADGVKHAVQTDLAALQKILMLSCSVTALVTGMEEESGFREFVGRVGRDRALNQRFGKGFEVTTPPLDERLEALAVHACGAFEDWIYTLFRERDCLNRPGNAKLYSLLCKIRHRVQERLVRILVGGYACQLEGNPGAEGYRFTGCYFAGVGEGEERQAFVTAAVGRLVDPQLRLEEELQWTKDALKQDDSYHLAGQVILVLDLVLLIALAVKIIATWFWKTGA